MAVLIPFINSCKGSNCSGTVFQMKKKVGNQWMGRRNVANTSVGSRNLMMFKTAVRPCGACLSCDRHKRPQAARMMHAHATPLSSLGMTNRLCSLSSHSMRTVRACRMDREWDLTSGPVSKQ
jgi:hypothetical protein